MNVIRVKKLNEQAILPTYGSEEAMAELATSPITRICMRALSSQLLSTPVKLPGFPPALPWKFPKAVRD